MKLKAIAAVCALVFAGQAFAAATPPTPSVAAASTVKLFISGSSALQNTIAQLANNVFAVGSVSVFKDGTATATGASGSNYRAYAGTFDSTAPASLVGKTGILYETAAGGSIVGAVNVALATPTTRLDLTLDANCTVQTATDTYVTGAPVYSCVPTINVAPDGGVSDVEPALFTGINVPAGTPAVTPAIDAALTKQTTLAQPMSIIVTTNAGITNLTKAQVTALMGGFTTDWSNVDFFAATPLAAGPVIVCKRTAGSGTQAAINDIFFGYPCSTSTQAPKAAQGNGTNYTVIENSSSGALAACMTAAVKGTAPGYTINITSGAISTAAPSATTITLPAGSRAIGLMGLDRVPGTFNNVGIIGYSGVAPDPIGKQPELYAPISINGVAPTVLNAALGSYDVVVLNSWNSRVGTVAGIAPMSGDQLTFFNSLASLSGDGVKILGSSKVPPVLGVAALSNATTLNYDGLLNTDGTLTNPTIRFSKANSCQPSIQNQ